jgi:hypothetical protein
VHGEEFNTGVLRLNRTTQNISTCIVWQSLPPRRRTLARWRGDDIFGVRPSHVFILAAGFQPAVELGILPGRIVPWPTPSVPFSELPFRAARCRPLRQPGWPPLHVQAHAKHVPAVPAAATFAGLCAQDCFYTGGRPTFLRPGTGALRSVAPLPLCVSAVDSTPLLITRKQLLHVTRKS